MPINRLFQLQQITIITLNPTLCSPLKAVILLAVTLVAEQCFHLFLNRFVYLILAWLI